MGLIKTASFQSDKQTYIDDIHRLLNLGSLRDIKVIYRFVRHLCPDGTAEIQRED